MLALRQVARPALRCFSTSPLAASAAVAPIAPTASAAPAAPLLDHSAGPSSAPAAAGLLEPRKNKFKNGFKRASATMSEIHKESVWMYNRKLADFRAPLPNFNIGDAVEVSYALDHGEKTPTPTRGTVIGRRRRGLDSKFTILNAMDEEWYTATYTYASPLLRGMKIMRRNHHSDGEKRARRAKLNYLFGRDYKTYLVDSSTKEASEILREKRERKEAQRQGKVYMKERTAAGVAAAGGKAAAKAASAAKAAATKGGKGKGKGGKK